MFSSHHSLGSRFALNKSRPGLPQFALNAPNGSAGEKPKGFGLFRGSSGRSRVAPTKEKAVTVMVSRIFKNFNLSEFSYLWWQSHKALNIADVTYKLPWPSEIIGSMLLHQISNNRCSSFQKKI